ncbi:uncharacterized protein [Leptinotarsa decemlineata]|uniref:uncharacterized protein n=1 Tax=Leptinotarsa decemlineata TaxID=7539 RepID=UPI003D306F1D
MNDLIVVNEINEGQTNDEVENGKSEVSEDSEQSDSDDGGCVRRGGKSKRSESFALSFRDVKDSIRTFDGKDDYPVDKWILDFEQISKLTEWNDLQKLIYAKQSLTGLAKLFIQSEKGITNWSILKKKLKAEFEVKVSSAQIHKLLMSRKKKREESVQKYVLSMREIGSIIDGIQDDTSYKIILYGVRDFSEFKDRVKIYEQVRAGRSTQGYERSQGKDSRKDWRKEMKTGNDDKHVRKRSEGRCFSCGNRGHMSEKCPDKFKGTKCFSCSGYGHVSTNCPKKMNGNQDGCSSSIAIIEMGSRNSVNITIDGIQLTALLDTGSDITAIRQDVYDMFFK